MDNPKQQVVERLQQANNILVTVSNNPSVDQLSACIGLTLALNKMGKHATAVFSGEVPSTIEFLQPERTLEKNTDSLRDFIIALDKSKADKLRYKVEDRMVKIFITPYRTSISDKDLDFSQGDFNVDVVLAIGVHTQADLDLAITAHGRILHDATVMTLNTKPGGELGSINWLDGGASSLSELGVQLLDDLDKKLMDGQIATALLTGIVAETERFSNQRTSPQTMSISAELMSAGANQQLVATKLEEPTVIPEPAPITQTEEKTKPAPKSREQKTVESPPVPNNDGTIEIAHDKSDSELSSSEPLQPTSVAKEDKPSSDVSSLETPSLPPVPEQPEEQAPQIHIDDQGHLHPFGAATNANTAMPSLPPVEPLPGITHDDRSRLLTEPEPSMLTNSPLTANTRTEDDDDNNSSSSDSLSLPEVGLLNREPLPSQQPESTPDQPSSIAPTLQPLGAPNSSQTPSSVVSPGVSPLSSQQPNPGLNPDENTNLSAPTTNLPGTRTLSEIEQDVHSPHIENTMPSRPMVPPQPQVITPTNKPVTNAQPMVNPASENMTPQNLDAARDAVQQAISASAGNTPDPIQALNAQPMSYGSLHEPDSSAMTMPEPQIVPPQTQPDTIPQPISYEPPVAQPGIGDTQAPPPVPPPMMPPTFPAQ